MIRGGKAPSRLRKGHHVIVCTKSAVFIRWKLAMLGETYPITLSGYMFAASSRSASAQISELTSGSEAHSLPRQNMSFQSAVRVPGYLPDDIPAKYF